MKWLHKCHVSHNTHASTVYSHTRIDNEQYPVSELVKGGSGLLRTKKILNTNNNDIHVETDSSERILSSWQSIKFQKKQNHEI